MDGRQDIIKYCGSRIAYNGKVILENGSDNNENGLIKNTPEEIDEYIKPGGLMWLIPNGNVDWIKFTKVQDMPRIYEMRFAPFSYDVNMMTMIENVKSIKVEMRDDVVSVDFIWYGILYEKWFPFKLLKDGISVIIDDVKYIIKEDFSEKIETLKTSELKNTKTANVSNSNLFPGNTIVMLSKKFSIKKLSDGIVSHSVKINGYHLEVCEISKDGGIVTIEDEKKEDKNLDDAPLSYLCPIMKNVMNDPVIVLESGITYERKNIEYWFNRSNQDPYTGKYLINKSLYPNKCLRDAIDEWKKMQGTGKTGGHEKK